MPGQASVAQHEGVNECDFLANLKAIAVGFTACVCASVWVCVCVSVCVRLCVCVCVCGTTTAKCQKQSCVIISITRQKFRPQLCSKYVK